MEARRALRDLKTTDPIFWNELVTAKDAKVPTEADNVAEDEPIEDGIEDLDADDSEVTVKTLIKAMINDKLKPGVVKRSSEALMSAQDADDIEFVVEPESEAETSSETVLNGKVVNKQRVKHEVKGNTPNITTVRRGTRTKYPNKQYAAEAFWQHHDDNPSDVDEI